VCSRLGGQRGAVRAEDYIFFYGKGKENHQLVTRFFVHHRIVRAVKRVEFVSAARSLVRYNYFEYACNKRGEK
jgi:hypothetical protein